MNEKINFIRIGRNRETLLPRKWVKDCEYDSGRQRAARVPETMDGTSHIGNVRGFFKGNLDITLNFVSDDDFAEASEVLDDFDGFVAEVYDKRIRMWVIRKFELVGSSIQSIVQDYRRYRGVVDFNFTAKSVFAYDSYDEMRRLATSDSRFE